MNNVPSPSDVDVLSILPAKLRERLMPFQKEGVHFAINKNGRCLIADEMGLGKTIQAIAVAYYYRAEWPVLIIVPSSLKFCWIEEIEKWLPDVLPNQINLVHCGTDASGIANSLITIVSYGLLRHPSSQVIKEAVKTQQFKIIICDESHYLKNNKSLSSKTIIPLVKAANRRILLSGTPALAKPVELYPQIDAICPGKFGTFWQFTDRYCDARTLFFGKFRKRQFDGASNLEELQQKLTSMLMIRREKTQVLTELPPKQRQRVLFELKESHLKKEILDSFSELRKKIRRGDKNVMKILETEEFNSREGETLVSEASVEEKDDSVFSEISKLYKLSGDAKIGPVREYIEMLCDNEELKFLVFAYHHDMMNGVQQTLWEKKVKFVRIDGTTKSGDRQAYVTQFQSDPQTRVAILSILAAGVGLTFTSAKLVVFAELYWTPGVMVQCEDRAHRIGQTSCLPVHYLVARGTMDEWVWSAVCKKTIVTSTALTGHSKKLDHEEGDKYQIDLLSNADVWQPREDNTDVDVADLIQKHRPADQRSILQFFTSQKAPEVMPGRKRKLVSETKGDNLKSFETKRLRVVRSKNVESKISSPQKTSLTEIVISSDEESQFQTPKIKRQTSHLFKKKRAKVGMSGYRLPQKKTQFTRETQMNRPKNIDEETGKKVPDNSLLKYEESQILSEPDDSSSTLTATETSPESGAMHGVSDHVRDTKKLKETLGLGQTECINPRSQVDGKAINDDLGHSPSGDQTLTTRPGRSDVDSLVSEGCTDGQWSCTLCTFNNHSELSVCEMCDTPKKKIPGKRAHLKSMSEQKSGTPNNGRQSHLCDCDLSREKILLSTVDQLSNRKQDLCCDKELTKLKSPIITKGQPALSGQCHAARTLDQDLEDRCQSPDLFDDKDQPTLDSKIKGRHDPSPGIDEVMSEESDIEDLSAIVQCRKLPSIDGCDPAQSFKQRKVLTTEPESMDTAYETCEELDMHPDTCGLLATQQLESMGTVDRGRESSQNFAPGVTEDVGSISVTSEDPPLEGKSSCTQEARTVYKVFQFSCSSYTGRIYLYDQDGKSLDINFHPIDLDMGNYSELPDVLQTPQHQKLLHKFLREWSSLSDTKKRLIAKRGLVFASPLSAFEEVKSVKGSKLRHLTKEYNLTSAVDIAKSVHGSVRVISKHSKVPTNLSQEPMDTGAYQGLVQTITEAGVPLCLQCQKPYDNPLLSAKTLRNPENAWQLRLCSYPCMDKYWTLTKAGYCRDQIYDIEHGVCRLCHYDTHAIFTQIKIIKDFAARSKLISESPYSVLTAKQKQKMVENPQAGQFWHLDHITPVWQGGGLCDLDNMRTLCTPCHLKVTRRQAGQRANVKRLSSSSRSHDITAFFQRH